jgi:hypothetical protein
VKLRLLADAMGHVKVLISKVRKEVVKVMMAMIGGLKWQRAILEAMKMGDIGSSCVSDVWYISCSSGLGMRGWQLCDLHL